MGASCWLFRRKCHSKKAELYRVREAPRNVRGLPTNNACSRVGVLDIHNNIMGTVESKTSQGSISQNPGMIRVKILRWKPSSPGNKALKPFLRSTSLIKVKEVTGYCNLIIFPHLYASFTTSSPEFCLGCNPQDTQIRTLAHPNSNSSNAVSLFETDGRALMACSCFSSQCAESANHAYCIHTNSSLCMCAPYPRSPVNPFVGILAGSFLESQMILGQQVLKILVNTAVVQLPSSSFFKKLIL